MENKIRALPVFLAVLGMAFSVSFQHACHKETEEERVKHAVQAIQKGTEIKDIRAILSHISKNYRDPQGNDREGIKGLLLFYFYQHKSISVILNNLEVTVREASATARFEAILSGRAGDSGTILPETLGAYRFSVNFSKESGEWRVVAAQWERLGEAIP